MSRFPCTIRNNLLPIVHSKAPILHQDQLPRTPVPSSVPVVSLELFREREGLAAVHHGRLLGPKAAIPSKDSGDGINYKSRT